MGTFYHFECPVCGYGADVCGGDDVGIMITTTTIHCDGCRELYDVFTTFREFQEEGAPPGRLGRARLSCPENGEHSVRKWRHPGRCPRCSGRLERTSVVLNWA